MAGYLFHPFADAEQDEIFRRSRDIWGAQQAEDYIRGLHRHLGLLADTPGIWRPLPLRLGHPQRQQGPIFVSRFQRHYIFYRMLPSGRLGVMRLLDVRMDMPKRLRADLERLVFDPEQ